MDRDNGPLSGHRIVIKVVAALAPLKYESFLL